MDVVLTCEHAGNRVPARYRARFVGAERLLASHSGWDPGALSVSRLLAKRWRAPLITCETTRLLVDTNRSPHNPAVFSRFTRSLPVGEREALLERHRDHWDRVRAALDAAGPRVLHVAVHSFTPVLRGETRAMDVGLLYDPSRAPERETAIAWQRRLRERHHDLRVRRNAPDRGATDGLTTALRRERSARRYVGIEIELNQRVVATRAGQRTLAAALAALRPVPDAT